MAYWLSKLDSLSAKRVTWPLDIYGRLCFKREDLGKVCGVVDTRLIHDAAFAAATALAEIVESKYSPEERTEFHRQAYEVCKAAIEAYTIQKNREAARLGPSRN